MNKKSCHLQLVMTLSLVRTTLSSLAHTFLELLAHLILSLLTELAVSLVLSRVRHGLMELLGTVVHIVLGDTVMIQILQRTEHPTRALCVATIGEKDPTCSHDTVFRNTECRSDESIPFVLTIALGACKSDCWITGINVNTLGLHTKTTLGGGDGRSRDASGKPQGQDACHAGTDFRLCASKKRRIKCATRGVRLGKKPPTYLYFARKKSRNPSSTVETTGP